MKQIQFNNPELFTPKDAWDRLSLAAKAEIMKVAVKNGIYDLQTIRNKYNKFAEGGEVEEEELPPIVPFKQRTEVIVTPDPEYNQYLNTLPDNQRFTPNDAYDSYYYWKLNGKPKNFEEAYSKGMFHYDHSDNGYHANSIAFGDDGVGYFMKPKTHDTVGYETDWFNKGLVTEEGGYQRPMTPEERAEWLDFRSKYILTNDPARPNYYMYKPKNKHSFGGPLVETAMNEYMHGGPMGNYYDGFGNFVNSLKAGVQKARQKVKDWRLDKSPGEHVYSALESTANSDEQYRRNLYNTIDPTSDVPSGLDIIGYVLSALASKFGEEAPYTRVKNDSVADAAWAKRLGQPYNKSALIDNGDGTFRLPASNEAEMPIDTTFLKNRIKDNQKLLNQVHGKRRGIVGLAIDADTKALDSLRKTYATGEPVEMDEHSYINRNWNASSTKDLETSPLNVLHRYTMQYDKDSNKMKYWDLYDFNEFEQFVPGKPFKIQGSIDLNKRK